MRALQIAGIILVRLALLYLQFSGPSGMVTRYCSYGSVSDAQYEGCIEHVSEDEIEQRDTDAARYARRELEGCDYIVNDECRMHPNDNPDP